MKKIEDLTFIDVATNLLKMNLGSPEQIAQAVNLPLEEVLALKNNSNNN